MSIATAIVKKIVDLVTESEEERTERLKKEKEDADRREQERLALEALRKQKLGATVPQARALARDVKQIEIELEKIDTDLDNVEEVIERIRRIVEKSNNNDLREHMTEKLDKLSEYAANRKGAPDAGSAEQEVRTRSIDTTKALEIKKLQVGELLGRAFFSKKDLEQEEAKHQQDLGAEETRMDAAFFTAMTRKQLDEIREALQKISQSEEGLKRVQNQFVRSEKEQKENTRELEQVAEL